MTTINPIHPGEHLAEFIEEFNITAYRLAKDIHVSATRIDQILKLKRAITADTAIRLGLYFGNTPQFWMNLQSGYELEISNIEDNIVQIVANA